MPDLTPEMLAELRRLAESATPGPWVSGDPSFGEGNAQCIVSISERAMGRDIQGPNLRPALFDVEFIAAANPAVMLTLLDAAAERDEIAGRLAHLLCDLTGGRMSKTSYSVPVMVQEIEQYLSECHESDLKDERDALAAAVERVQALHVAARFSGATRWVCSECCIDWPCPTSRALNESETGGES